MQKIISLFQRNYDGDRLVRNEITPGAEWVTAGVGRATQKFDGTCCAVRNGKLYKRHELKDMYVDHYVDGPVWVCKRAIPEAFEPADDVDPVTKKQQGWLPVGDGPEDQWHREAFHGHSLLDGTYELIGPKVQGNAERMPHHVLVLHGSFVLKDCPRDFDGIRDFLASRHFEGIVWHHDDGRMVKIKTKDFGLDRNRT